MKIVSKKQLFKIHSWIGIQLSILFFIVCLSGTFATLSHEMDWLFMPEIRVTPTATFATKNEMAASIKEAYPDSKIHYWPGSQTPYLCDVVHVKKGGKRTYVFVNPHTGKVQGSANITFQRFFRDLHYYLFIPFQIGHFTVLFFGFMLLFAFLTALFFYKKWYKKWLDLKLGKGLIVFLRSAHRVVGVWSVPFALIISVTGIWYFAERANISDIRNIANPKAPSIESSHSIPNTYELDYNRVVTVAENQIEGLVVKDILPPPDSTKPIYLTGKSTVPLVRNRANRVYIDPNSFEVLEVKDAKYSNTVTWLNDIVNPLHFGTWGGLPTKILYFILGLGLSGLVASGVWMGLTKKNWRKDPTLQKEFKIWTSLNICICICMFIFMYHKLIIDYQASILVLSVVSMGWLIFLGLLWYVFYIRLRRHMA